MIKVYYQIATRYLMIVLFVSLMLVIKGTSLAATPAAGALCFDKDLTYYCGAYTGTVTTAQPYGNECTPLLVINPNGTQSNVACTKSPNLFEITVGNPTICYIEGYDSSGNQAWIAQPNCNSGDFTNPQPRTTNMPDDLTNNTPDQGITNDNCSTNSDKCDLTAEYINPIINFLAILVGVIVVISVVLGGIQYSAAGDNPQAVSAARSRIINALIAALAFLFLWGFLQFIVPGGFLNG